MQYSFSFAGTSVYVRGQDVKYELFYSLSFSLWREYPLWQRLLERMNTLSSASPMFLWRIGNE